MAAKKKADEAPEGVATIDAALAADVEEEKPTKTVALKSPWGSKVTVAAEDEANLKDAGFTAGK